MKKAPSTILATAGLTVGMLGFALPAGAATAAPSPQHPITLPTGQPTSHPTGQPTSHPTGFPTSHPTGQPTSHPTGQPTFPLSQGGVVIFSGMDNVGIIDVDYLDYEMTMPWPMTSPSPRAECSTALSTTRPKRTVSPPPYTLWVTFAWPSNICRDE